MKASTIKATFKRWPFVQGLQVTAGVLLKKAKINAFASLQQENRDYANLEALGFTVEKSGQYTAITKPGAGFKQVLIRRGTSDIRVFFQIFILNEYAGLLELIKDKGDVKTIIDAGANIGLASVKFAAAFPNASVIAVEPDAGNLTTAVKNMQVNGVKHTAVESGIWDRRTKLYIDRSFLDGKEWAIAVTETPNGGPSLQSVSISDIVRQHDLQRIDLLKIDVEGSEKQIFFGKNANLDFLSITKYIAIEVHEEVISYEQIGSLLAEHGFELSRSGEYLIGQNTRGI